ncbi:hypothetical protein LSH36_359g00065 [Paralvinella palmiformis]|uniref:Kazal-like domain-containing protein n=1 Tax=Paralvinella palmiformis TaxID=53620 RepID=A0AAD9JF99_9ANNE|nr:hypothetical protein LSH36_359g00065 [Paralvinella palmiformis]
MSDIVSLQYREDNHMNDGVFFEGPTFGNTTRKDSPVIVRVPDSITTWMFTGVSMSPKQGFSLASSVSLRTFQYFFLDFTLPYSVIRDEQIKIPLTVHNYLHACVRVHLQLHIPSTLEVLHGKETLKKFCIGNEETKTLFYDMIFRDLGIQKISATAEAYADSRCCSGILSDESPNKRYLTGMDSVKKQILVEPEGILRYYTQSVYFCPNSRIQISTPNKYQFQYVARPPEMDSFTFNVKARNDARIALSPGPKDPNQMMEIVIGGDFNQQSWIMMAENGDTVSNLPTPGVLSEVGWGTMIGNHTTQFLSHKTDRQLKVEYIGFSTGWGAEGAFTIWDRGEIDDSGYGEVMYLSLPESAVRGSAFARAKLTGDLMAPNLHNMDKLLRLPRGCGEQNMANFAPNVYVLQYLDKTGQLKEDTKLKILELLTKGYQRQLTYQRRDGSYSAFGLRDSTGNTWLSAFVLKTLSQARTYIYVDNNGLERTKSWIVDTQRPDGSFESVGRIINKEIQGGLSGRIALTAFVLTAFQSFGIKERVDDTSGATSELVAVYSAGRYLERNMHLIREPYTAALTAYALSLLNSDSAYSALKILSQTAIKKNGMTFWRLYHYDIREFHVFSEEPSKTKEIEIAGYAVLSYLTKDDISSAFPVVKWLMTQRNSYGGFLSTQDTVVALQAMSQYAIQSFTKSLSMTVSLASTNMDLLEKFHLNSNNSDVIQTVVIPSLPARLFLSASGEGCAMFQVEVQYNVPDPIDHPAFDLWVRMSQHHRPGSRRHMHRPEVRITLDICTKWLHPGSSNMAVLEVFIITGYTPDIDSLEKLLERENLKLKRYEIDGRKVIFYFDEIQSRCVTCLNFEIIRKYKVENSNPVPVRIFDYYEGGCSLVYGCNNNFPYAEEMCSCYQDCHENVSQICASDGSFYRNQCTMEVYACQKDLYLEVMPNEYCEVQDSLQEESDDRRHLNFVTTVSWRNYLTASSQTEATSKAWLSTTQSDVRDRKESDYHKSTDTPQSEEKLDTVYHQELNAANNYTGYPYSGFSAEVTTEAGESIALNLTEESAYDGFDGLTVTRNTYTDVTNQLFDNKNYDEYHDIGVIKDDGQSKKVNSHEADAADSSHSGYYYSNVISTATEPNVEDNDSILRILQPTTMRLLELEPVKAEMRKADIGLQHPYIEETETMTEKYGNREMHPHLSELESNTSPQHSVSDEYSANADPATHTETGYASKKIDFSGMELSYLSDSELEDLLSGRHSKEETKAVGEKSEKSNSSMQEKEAVDPASDNKEDNGDDDDDDDDNATERGGDGKTDSEYYKKETRPSGIEVFRPNLDDANELNDADHQRGITHWLKEGLSDKDFLTMLALYNSIDSSETEETGEEHSDFTNGNSSRQTEETPPIPNETEHEMGNADSNEHKGLFEFLHENSSHPNEPNVYSSGH